jgi:hypothetical protein
VTALILFEAALRLLDRSVLDATLTTILKADSSLLLEAQRKYVQQGPGRSWSYETDMSEIDMLPSVDDLPAIDGLPSF